jgi:AAA+ ATPase superfamily predicted ATPase
MRRPPELFDRRREWDALERFAGSAHPGTMVGLVYGRRRQGKTFLLEALTEATGGFYFAALRQSEAQNLERLAEQYRAYTRARVRPHFPTWDEAIQALLALGEGAKAPIAAVIDEFPYLLESAPQLPSLLQSLLSPRSEAVKSWPTRLILCGSALSTMRGLLAGTAPLRGRASLELIVHPFGYRDAAAFWGVARYHELAMRLHALVGGTPGYRAMCGDTAPGSGDELDEWVVTRLLDPASAMFREGHVLLAEEERVTETSVYFAVLAAISQGKTRRGEIASAVGKAEGALAHPLTVLTNARLVAALADAFKQKRTTYHIAEPVLRLHQLIIAPNEGRLARHQGASVWAEHSGTVASKIYGPHFEQIARTWCEEHASPDTLGGPAGDVAPTYVACREHRLNHEVDVVVLGSEANKPVLAIGEAKWRTEPCHVRELHGLEHVRTLLSLTDRVKLLIFSRSGFHPPLQEEAADRADVELVDLERLYKGA